MTEIEINGVKYQEIEKQAPKANSSRALTMLTVMAAMIGDYSYGGSQKKQKQSPSVNLIEEFKLIQEKKSKLSANSRKWVINQFHRQFKIVNK